VQNERRCQKSFNLPVGGAFHSPMMEPAREELAAALKPQLFNPNMSGVSKCNCKCRFDPNEIKKNLIIQLTAPVKWTQSVQQMTLMVLLYLQKLVLEKYLLD
jgi:[acyl-carrier-protein] S-malonyltransferase